MNENLGGTRRLSHRHLFKEETFPNHCRSTSATAEDSKKDEKTQVIHSSDGEANSKYVYVLGQILKRRSCSPPSFHGRSRGKTFVPTLQAFHCLGLVMQLMQEQDAKVDQMRTIIKRGRF